MVLAHVGNVLGARHLLLCRKTVVTHFDAGGGRPACVAAGVPGRTMIATPVVKVLKLVRCKTCSRLAKLRASRITARERAALALRAAGLTWRGVGARLGVSGTRAVQLCKRAAGKFAAAEVAKAT
ncbi:MAG TPA: hypothetical protein VF341_07975 [Anaeromyxobacteraceae bacterium]